MKQVNGGIKQHVDLWRVNLVVFCCLIIILVTCILAGIGYIRRDSISLIHTPAVCVEPGC